MKTAIVTGATKGIGKAIAIKLASLKYAMVLVGRNKIQLETFKETIEKLGTPCLTLALDLSDDKTPETIVWETIEHFGQIDVLVNNAGLAHSAPISETEIETWDTILK